MNISDLDKNWDLIIIGGGVTGAGILREAVRMNLRVLLLEQNDFAWGTSSRSSKLVHGGLRYLKQGKISLTRDAVAERQRLLREAPGLVEPLPFMMPIYSDYGPSRWFIEAGLSLYDLLAGKWEHRFYNKKELLLRAPRIRQENLVGGFHFSDAQVDDARLVLRLISEAVAAGGCALNYTVVKEILRDARGNVAGVSIEDAETHESKRLSAQAVINAAGSWAEKLHPSPNPNLHIRPLRGSHLVFPAQRLPVSQAMMFSHPRDKRPLFVIPWEGAVIFGTTDTDHPDLSSEPVITGEEFVYLTEALNFLFPSLFPTGCDFQDCLSSFAGIRPVLSRGKLKPSQESREHIVWADKGLVTITGGKLTTFRMLAWDALEAAMPFLPPCQLPAERVLNSLYSSRFSVKRVLNSLYSSRFSVKRVLNSLYSNRGKGQAIFPIQHDKPYEDLNISLMVWRRLCGRYGNAGTKEMVMTADSQDLATIPGTCTIWAELPFAAKHEHIRHLTDLLLRRVRIGLLTPQGGKDHIGRIRKLCEPVLPWDETRWEQEIKMYFEYWKHAHYPDIR
ncbi:MAG: hypothetical protein BWK80_03395 [Desulfobacteraceae bacterium IS3]|nr:MAG: hypothetical protein BWK80_03395 [Desulfobacteraceae bacterium IS3]